MITEQDLREAIAECQGERNPNANTCVKLAAYYTILKEMHPVESYSYAPAEVVSYNGSSEFAEVVDGKSLDAVFKILEELVDTIEMLFPKLYYATMDKLKDL